MSYCSNLVRMSDTYYLYTFYIHISINFCTVTKIYANKKSIFFCTIVYDSLLNYFVCAVCVKFVKEQWIFSLQFGVDLFRRLLG